MTEIKPTNEACAAVELYAAYRGKIRISPFRAAYVAAELVRIGARFKAISERLVSANEETYGRYPEAEQRIARDRKRRERLEARAIEAIKGWGKAARVEMSDDGLRLDLHTTVRGRAEMTTLTR